jgi:hypothetical protein
MYTYYIPSTLWMVNEVLLASFELLDVQLAQILVCSDDLLLPTFELSPVGHSFDPAPWYDAHIELKAKCRL